MAKVLRVGFIGCGGIATGKHLPAQARLQDEGRVELVAFCDLKIERAQAAAEKYGVPGAQVTADYTEVIARDDIDVIHVLTENVGHAPISIAAMRAGKHVMCEKPMAKTYQEALEMCKVAKETGKKLTIGYQTRFDKENLYLKQICDEGMLGDIYYARCVYTRRRGLPTWGVFTDKEKQGGGPLIDIATHELDRTLWYMNNYEPDRVLGVTFQKLNYANSANSSGPWNPDEMDVEDSAFAIIKMKNGATIMLECSWCLNFNVPNASVLCGTKAGADRMENKIRLNVDHGQTLMDIECKPDKYSINLVKDLNWDRRTQYWGKDLEAETFYRAIVEDKDPVVLPEQAAVVSRILEGIYISAQTCKEYIFEL
ncbi:MAG: Gfo/Idh/MocA family oxidoreductase [Clostridia bacterium]|nr:Gfo/Idh/MocA family oxidoreductase [Clostridia bacterium]